MSRDQKLLRVASVKTKMQLAVRKYYLGNEQIYKNECLPNFELKFKFLENLRKPLTLKSTRKRIEEKNKMAEMGEESQTTVLAEENQTRVAKENQTGISAKKGQAFIPRKLTEPL